MTRFKRLLLATVCMLTFAEGASALSVEKIADTPKAEQASVLYFGKPLDCNVDMCKTEEAAAPAADAPGKALVDAYGMPTNMPALIRGSEGSQQVTVSMPRKVKWAGSTPSASPSSSSSSASSAKPAKTENSDPGAVQVPKAE